MPTPPPLITELPPRPDIADGPAAYDVAAYAFYDGWQLMATEASALGEWMNGAASETMAAAIAGNLSAIDLSASAGYFLAVNVAGTAVEVVDIVEIVEATQVQAEAGTDSETFISPRRAKDAIDHNEQDLRQVFSWSHSSNVSEIVFSGLGSFTRLEIDLNVTTSSGTQLRVQVSNNGGTSWRTAGYIGGSNDTVGGDTDTDGLRVSRVDVTDHFGRVHVAFFNSPSAKTTLAGQFYGETSRAVNALSSYDTAEAHDAIRIVDDAGATIINGGAVEVRGFKR